MKFGGSDERGVVDDTWELPSNRPPSVTAASSPSPAYTGQIVTLSAAFSDPDGDTHTWRWVQTFGPQVTLAGTSSASASFTPPCPGDYGFEVVASDGREAAAFAPGTVSIPNRAPLSPGATASTSLVLPDTAVQLTGTATDPDGDTVTYSWQVTSQPPGGNAVLTGGSTRTPTFSAHKSGTYTLTLTASDGRGGSAQASVNVTVNTAPTVSAGANQTVNINTPVQLSGSGADADGDSLTYSWARLSGPAVTLANPGTATPTFTPTSAGVLVLRLTVSDPNGGSATSDLTVTINTPPTASAGSNRTVNPGTLVQLSGSGADADGDSLSYSWARLSGPVVTLDNAGTASPSFTPSGPGVHVFRLTVGDGRGGTVSSDVMVTVNALPTASAGSNRTVLLGSVVQLAGSGSDADGDVLTCRWSQLGATPVAVVIEDYLLPVAWFSATVTGTYTFQLRVEDGQGGSATATETVLVLPVPNRPPTISISPLPIASRAFQLTATTGDPEGDVLTQQWRQESGPGPAAFMTPELPATRVSVLSSGLYRFSLTVRDSRGGETIARCDVTVDASGPSPSLIYREAFTVGGRPVYTVPTTATLQVSFDEAVVESGAFPHLRFTTISGLGSLASVRLTTNSSGQYLAQIPLSELDAGTFEVGLEAADRAGNPVNAGLPNRYFVVNRRPAVTAGPPKTGVRLRSRVVFDDAEASDPDADPVTVAWDFASLPAGSLLTGADLGDRLFPRAFFTPDAGGRYILRLEATDGKGGTTAVTTTVDVLENRPPQALAGPDVAVSLGQTVLLDGTRSLDPEGGPLSFSWEFLATPAGSTAAGRNFSGASSARPFFFADAAGIYELLLTVSDDAQASSTDTVAVLARQDEPDTVGAVDTSLAVDGASVAGVIDTSDDLDVFRFEAQGGRRYTVDCAATAGLAVSVRLQPFEQSVAATEASTTASGTVVLADYRPRINGLHFVTISATGQQSRGPYVLRVTSRPDSPLSPPKTWLTLATEPRAEGLVSTAGTSAPLSALALQLVHDPGRVRLSAVSPQSPAADDFSFTSDQLLPPWVNLRLQRTGSRAPLRAGLLSRFSLVPLAPGAQLVAGDVSIFEVSASANAENPVVRRPTADAGVDLQLRAATGPGGTRLFLSPGHRAEPSATIVLDGSLSTDGNRPARPLSYAWSVAAAPVETVSLEASAGPTAAFRPLVPGQYRFRMVVSNGILDSPPDEVSVSVRFERGLEPVAEPSVEDLASGRRADTASAPLAVDLGARLQLDGRRSLDPDPEDAGRLLYSWRQVEGPAALTVPSSAATFLVTASASGSYAVELQAVEPQGERLQSRPRRLTWLVLGPRLQQPRLTLRATARVDSGSDEGDVPELGEGPPLRTRAPTEVWLSAQVEDPGVPDRNLLLFLWRQLDGPPVAIRQEIAGVVGDVQNVASFEARDPGVHEFECRVRQVNANGERVGAEVTRKLRVAVSDGSAQVPSAAAALRAPLAKGAALRSSGPSRTLTAGTAVTLEGSAPAAGAPVYTWTQLAGLPVSLSNPFSRIATFVVPVAPDTRQYSFALTVDDGSLRSPPAIVAFTAVPPAPQPITALVPLHAGLNFVGLPVDPGTPARPWRLSELAAATGSQVVVRTEAGRFRTWWRGIDSPSDAPVEPAAGYLVLAPAGAKAVQVRGMPWPAGVLQRQLCLGLNLVSCPLETPATSTAQTLLTSSGAGFVARTLPIGPSGSGRIQVHLGSQTSPPFALEAGRGYLLHAPAPRLLRLGPGER